MNEIAIIVKQIIILTLLGITGFVAAKRNILPEESQKHISALIIKITTPFLIFTTMGSYSFTRDTLKNGVYIFAFGIVFILIAGLISLAPCKVMGIKDKARNIYIAQSMFGNVIFMAYPLLEAMYGKTGILYAIFYNLSNDAILWTLGVYLFNKHNSNSWKENLSHLINPNTLAFVGGIILIALKSYFRIGEISVYNAVWDVFYTTFNGLGKTTIYISMIFIGMLLANTKISGVKDVLSRTRYLVLSIFKLLIVPAIAIVFFRLTNNYFDKFVKIIVVLQLAMPSSTVVSALALQYDSDYNAATESIFVSTILSIFTLPIIVYLLV
ncbi:AEC family transporter [Ruminiclostridium herbifermentans]|uniref:AEC family transporter n=1 Tax=Ruminiclostridium herbifermentans TaxID=2488810 RepID=A0A4U7JDV7_9FIRM|nr:AEC family transporter [Ruminiclostridium herbifermentans]QNU65875.1 AEC family transporter [Ruminiclostridium herbifermentans]